MGELLSFLIVNHLKYNLHFYFKEKDLKNHLAAVHESNMHGGEPLFECNFCERKFHTSNNLKKHTNNCHRDVLISELVDD